MAPRCLECGKKIYSESRATRAALSTSRAIGKPVRIYECPIDNKAFHLTTEEVWDGPGR